MSNVAQLETFILADILTASVTALLCVNSNDTITLMRNLDDRLQAKKTNYNNLSFQVLNAYQFYLRYMPIIDNEQFIKYDRVC